ncbi:MAPEG family protein [Rhodoferax sp. WC2427]|uniref:MAPEG family protein n=1 Tax=Rhodoferax sp. WC2427 TaxID=3234144 RepID=UPI003466F321
MTVPVWMLLGFATWTALLLLFTIGVYRWSRILSGRTAIRNFPADAAGGDAWYRRATRAHANCIENLPVFGAIVFGLYVGHVESPLVDTLATVVLVARIFQSLVHVCFVHTNTVATLRFTFFFVQFVCYFWLVGTIVATYLRVA